MKNKILRPIHLILGLLSGIVIFTVSITGSITSFQEEIRSVVYSDLFEVEKSVGTKLSLVVLSEIAKKAHPKKRINLVRIKSADKSSVEIVFEDGFSFYINPYNGILLGSLNKETDFFGTVEEIHKSLYLGETGEVITKISVLVFLFMIISGIILWWPRNRKMMKQKVTIMRNVNWQKRNYDLHTVLGFYASLIIISTVLSGMIWAYDWAEDGLCWITNSKKSERIELESKPSKTTFYSINDIYQKSKFRNLEHKECIVFMPEDEKDIVRLSFRYNDKGFFRKQDNFYYDQYNGKLLKEKMFSSLSTGDKIKLTNINIHIGKVLGFFGQLLVFFASLICASLPITGFLIWRGRNKK